MRFTFVMLICLLFGLPIQAQDLTGRLDYCAETSPATGSTREMWQLHDTRTPARSLMFIVEDFGDGIMLCEQVYMSSEIAYTSVSDAAIMLQPLDFQPNLGGSVCQSDFEAIRRNHNPASSSLEPLETNTTVVFNLPNNQLLIPVYNGLLPLPIEENQWVLPQPLADRTHGLGFTAAIPFSLLPQSIDVEELVNFFPTAFVDDFDTLYTGAMPGWDVQVYTVLTTLHVDLTQRDASGQKEITLEFTKNVGASRLEVEVRADIRDLLGQPTNVLPAGIGRGDVAAQLRNEGWQILREEERTTAQGETVVWYLAQKESEYLLIELLQVGNDDYTNYRTVRFTSCNPARFLPDWAERP